MLEGWLVGLAFRVLEHGDRILCSDIGFRV